MKISLDVDKCRIEIVLSNGSMSTTASLPPVEALRAAESLKRLAEQLIEEFPNKEESET